jgi:hypothetical protein
MLSGLEVGVWQPAEVTRASANGAGADGASQLLVSMQPKLCHFSFQVHWSLRYFDGILAI